MGSLLLLPVAAAVCVSFVSGTVGTLLLARRSTYLAGALSHASLAGLGLAHYLSVVYGCAWATPVSGAFASAFAAGVFLAFRKAPPPGSSSDAVLSAIWSVGMALGLLFIALTPGYQTELLDYLFGSLLLVTGSQIGWMVLFCVLTLLVLMLFWRGILAICFHAEAAACRGAPVRVYQAVLSLVTSFAVVLLVQSVGIVLVIALLTLPGIAASALCKRLRTRMVLAAALCFLSLAAGLVISGFLDLQPSAPAVLCAAVFAAAAKLISRK